MSRNYADFYLEGRWQKTKSRLKKLGSWFWGALGLGGIVVAYVGSVATEILPAPGDLVCLVKEQFRDPAPGTRFTILISNLAGDSDGRQTNLVRDVFLAEHGLDVRRTCRVVTLDAIGGSVADAEAEALRRGQALLAGWNADLLVWGEVKKADQELNLWFLSGGNNTLGAPSYSLTDKLSLPKDFESDLGTQLVAVAAAAVSPATEQAGTYLVDLLEPVVAKLERLVDNPPAGFDAEQIAELQSSLGLAADMIAQQSGDLNATATAVGAFRAALEQYTRVRAPLDWAAAQNNLGSSLTILGERQSSMAPFQEAVTAFHLALEEWTRERAPLDWARTQSNLGNALHRLGERWLGTARLQEAVVAYRAALEEFTRQRTPSYWAATQNNLGTALGSLSERDPSTTRLEETVMAFRAALDETPRDRAPLYWAAVQSNLGNALANLGDREPGTARLEEAVAAYRAALGEYTRERVPLD